MNKKGFTLIELLAVIVILGIILTFAIMSVSGFIEKSEKETLINQADNIIDFVRNEVVSGANLDMTYNIENGKIVNGENFDYKGKLPSEGNFIISGDEIKIALTDGYWCVKSDLEKNNYKIIKKGNSSCKISEYPQFGFDDLSGTIYTYHYYFFDINYNVCVEHYKNTTYLDSGDKLDAFCSGERVYVGEGELQYYYLGDSKSNEEYLAEQGVISISEETPGDVVIPDEISGVPVKIIGEGAFNNHEIESIVFPPGLVSVGRVSFSDNLLTALIFPDSLTSIGDNAFSSNKINNVKFSSSLEYIGEEAFSRNNMITVDLPSTLKYIGVRAFNSNSFPLDSAIIYGRNSDSSIDYSTIVSYASNYEVTNKSIVIPSGVKKIGDNVFSIMSISNITFPNTLEYIGYSAFYSNNLTSITIPNSVTNIGDYAFSSNNLTSLTIPNSVTNIGNSTFSYNKLTSLTIPNSVTSIGNSAFNSNKLTNITIPNSVTVIGAYAFYKSNYSNNTLSSIIYSGTTAHDWNNIIRGSSGTLFTTGTVTNPYGNVIISAN